MHYPACGASPRSGHWSVCLSVWSLGHWPSSSSAAEGLHPRNPPRHSCGVPQPGMHMLRSARLQKLAGAAVFAGAGAAILCSPATQCEAEQRKGTGPLQRRSSVSDSINVVRADRSLAGAKPLSG